MPIWTLHSGIYNLTKTHSEGPSSVETARVLSYRTRIFYLHPPPWDVLYVNNSHDSRIFCTIQKPHAERRLHEYKSCKNQRGLNSVLKYRDCVQNTCTVFSFPIRLWCHIFSERHLCTALSTKIKVVRGILRPNLGPSIRLYVKRFFVSLFSSIQPPLVCRCHSSICFNCIFWYTG